MTDQEKIQKLEQVIEASFLAFKMLPDLTCCIGCEARNKELVEKIYVQIETAVNLKKEIV